MQVGADCAAAGVGEAFPSSASYYDVQAACRAEGGLTRPLTMRRTCPGLRLYQDYRRRILLRFYEKDARKTI